MSDQEYEYEYFVEMHRGYTPARKDGLWRRRGEDTWEYLSLLDWGWHPAGENYRVKSPPMASALEPVSAERAAGLEADRQGWVTYWALHRSEVHWTEGKPAITVVRRRSSPDRIFDEVFTIDNVWRPTATIYEFQHGRSSSLEHLVEIGVSEAEEIIQKRRGVSGATEL